LARSMLLGRLAGEWRWVEVDASECGSTVAPAVKAGRLALHGL
jgi:hypothetical protein